MPCSFTDVNYMPIHVISIPKPSLENSFIHRFFKTSISKSMKLLYQQLLCNKKKTFSNMYEIRIIFKIFVSL